MRMSGASYSAISQKHGLPKHAVIKCLETSDCSSEAVLRHHGYDVDHLKKNQISGLMTKIFNDQNKTFENLKEKAVLGYKNDPKECGRCKENFYRTFKQSLKDFKAKKFCSVACGNAFRAQKTVNLVQKNSVCKECSASFEYTIKRNFKARVFCKEACRVKYSKKNSLCKAKSTSKPMAYVSALTKKEIFEKRSSWQSARSSIQKMATKIFFKLNKKSCEFCGYSKHIEVCHIKSVSSFSEFSTLKEINSPSNLIGLCPNHHEEFDAGILTIEEIRKGKNYENC